MRARPVVLVVLALVLPACGDDAAVPTGGRTLVAASFDPLAEVVRQVGGDAVDVRDLTPVGAEPHDVELTSEQVDLVEDAALVVVLGGDFQPAVEEATERRDGRTLVVLDELGVDAQGDAHVWLDIELMAETVRLVAEVLAAVDPDAAQGYTARADEYRRQLTALDGRFEEALATCERRTIVVPHEAYGWLAARYDLEQVGLAGTDPHHGSDPRRLDEVAGIVESQGITTVFEDPGEPDETARTLARETGARIAPLDSLERRGQGDTADAGYVERMEANLAALTEALACEGGP